jgi:RloB-like protein
MNIKPRREGSKAPVRKILIVCEGEDTEPNYFRAFRVATTVCDVKGTGCNTLSLIQEAERLSSLKNYLEVWCVFDKDSFPIDSVQKAIQRAKKKGFRIAFSDECFELWYLLHFQYLDVGVNRVRYRRLLTEKLGERYEKNDRQMYDRLLNMQSDAISRAKRLKASHGASPVLGACKPYTTVHELVERLNRLARRAS